MHVKNTEPDSIQYENDASTVHLKFSSIGSGYFSTYYAFYFATPPNVGVIKNVNVESWDNNVIAQIEFDSLKSLKCYQAGLSKNDCKEFTCTLDAEDSTESDQQTTEKPSTTVDEEEKDVEVEVEAISSEELRIEIVNKCHAQNTTAELNRAKAKRPRKGGKKNRSFSESHCDELKEIEHSTQNCLSKNTMENGLHQLNPCPVHSKPRTYSESSNDDLHHVGSHEPFPLKSILKRRSSYLSASDISGDEQAYSCSLDLGVGSFTSIPEERGSDGQQMSESVRKTVRFDKNLCRKLLFR